MLVLPMMKVYSAGFVISCAQTTNPIESCPMKIWPCNWLRVLKFAKSSGCQPIRARYTSDDIIGTLASNVRKSAESEPAKFAIHIISKDKDLAQLLQGERDCLWEFSQNQRRYAEDIESDFGVGPQQICDYLALAGDSVDCITGVPGVGPVKARELLSKFGDLASVYSQLDAVRELPLRGAKSLAEKLAQHKAQAELSQKLATIVCEVDDPEEEFGSAKLEDLNRTLLDVDEMRAFLVEYRFQSEESERLVNQATRIAMGTGA